MSWLDFLAQLRVVRADTLSALHSSIARQADVIIKLKNDLSEARLDAALQEGKHLATADKLAAEHRARLNAEDATRVAQEASEKLWADLRASVRETEALRGDLAALQGQLKDAMDGTTLLQAREVEHIAQIKDAEERLALGAATVAALQDALAKLSLPAPPVGKVTRSSDDIRAALERDVGRNVGLVWDGTYEVVSKDELLRFARESAVTKETWVEERHDCDDFSLHMATDAHHWGSNMAIIAGMLEGTGYHAWVASVVLDGDNLVVVQIEPQYGTPVTPAYKPDSVYLL